MLPRMEDTRAVASLRFSTTPARLFQAVLNLLFSWKGETLYYRGIDVNSGKVEKPTANDPKWLKDLFSTTPARLFQAVLNLL